jgi:hypothetical protein
MKDIMFTATDGTKFRSRSEANYMECGGSSFVPIRRDAVLEFFRFLDDIRENTVGSVFDSDESIFGDWLVAMFPDVVVVDSPAEGPLYSLPLAKGVSVWWSSELKELWLKQTEVESKEVLLQKVGTKRFLLNLVSAFTGKSVPKVTVERITYFFVKLGIERPTQEQFDEAYSLLYETNRSLRSAERQANYCLAAIEAKKLAEDKLTDVRFRIERLLNSQKTKNTLVSELEEIADKLAKDD